MRARRRSTGPTIAMRRDSFRQLGRLQSFRLRRPQLRADLVEHITQLAKLLVVSQIERRAKIAAAQVATGCCE